MLLALVFGLVGWFFPDQSVLIQAESGESLRKAQLLSEEIEVTLCPEVDDNPLSYKVRAICKVYNPTASHVRVPMTSVAFGIRGKREQYLDISRAIEAQTHWFDVRQDNRRLQVIRDFSIRKQLNDLYSYEPTATEQERNERWLAEWEATIPGLSARRLELQRLVPENDLPVPQIIGERSQKGKKKPPAPAALPTSFERLEAAVKPYLINPEVSRQFYRFLTEEDPKNAIVEIIPELDPALRINVKQRAAPYISVLDTFAPERYQKYFPCWAAKIREWIEARPEVAQAAQVVLARHEKYLKYKVARDSLLTFVQAKARLSETDAENYVSFAEMKWPGPLDIERVLKSIRVEVEREIKAREQQIQPKIDKLEGLVGKGTVLCTLTGELYNPGSRRFWTRESEMNPHPLHIEIAPLGAAIYPGYRDNQPKILNYQLDLAPHQTVTLSIQYTLEWPKADKFEFGAKEFAYQMNLPATLYRVRSSVCRVRVPHSFFPIFFPEPAASIQDKDATTYTIPISGPNTHFYFNLLEKKNHLWLLDANQENVNRLQNALGWVRHPQARLVLEAGIISILARMEKPFAAWEQWLALKKENPNHPAEYLSFRGKNEMERLEEKFENIETFLKSPHIEIANNKGFLNKYLEGDLREVLVPKLVARQKETLTPTESLHLAAMLCHFGVEPEKNLAQVVALAGQSREMAREALAALTKINIDKSAQLEFFLQFLQPEPEKSDELSQDLHRLASYNLPHMRHPSVAGRLIEAYLQTSEPDVQSQILKAVLSIKPTLPFEQLMRLQLSDEIGETIWRQYVATLAESDLERARTVLRKWLVKRPKQKFILLKQLAVLGDPLIREPVIKEFEVTRDDRTRRELVSIVRAFGDPTLLLLLKFNPKLEPWMETALLDCIPNGTSDPRLFNWVEAQFQNADLNRRRELLIPYLRAFQKLGDRRALPYLYSMLEMGQHQEDIAKVIGEIVLDEALLEDHP